MNTVYSGTKPIAETRLVSVREAVPGMEVRNVWASEHNPFKSKLYDTDDCYVHQDTAAAMVVAQKALDEQGLALFIADGYRSMDTQKKLLELSPEEKRGKYVADTSWACHPRGIAVDVAICDKKSRKWVELPPPIHDERANVDYDGPDISDKAKKNRELLHSVMKTAGFVRDVSYEWWHFTLEKAKEDWDTYPQLNIPVGELAKHT